AADLSGRERMVTQVTGWGLLFDVSSDGRALLSTVDSRIGIRCVASGAKEERELGWLDASALYDFANDGKVLLFAELSYGEGRNTAIYLRKTDGSPAVRLGYGNRPSLSPDGKWVLCIRYEPGHSQLLLLPTGPGESRLLNVEGMRYESAEWFPDGKRILFTGNQAGHPVRTWIYDLDGEGPKPITPEGVRATRVSPDGHSFVIAEAHKLSLGDISGGSPRTISDLQSGETVVRWGGDGRYLFLRQLEGDTIRVSRLDVSTRRKEPWRV